MKNHSFKGSFFGGKIFENQKCAVGIFFNIVQCLVNRYIEIISVYILMKMPAFSNEILCILLTKNYLLIHFHDILFPENNRFRM